MSETEDGDEAAETTEASGSSGGILVWAHEQEPGSLHVDDPEHSLAATAWLRTALLEGAYGISSTTEFFPELLAQEAEMVDNGDGTFTATYTLRDGLMWSDGEPLTANDFKFTFDAMMYADGVDDEGNPNYVYLRGDRTGYDTVTEIAVQSDTVFTITWSEFFAGWKGILVEAYPAHQFSADPAEAAAQLNEALKEWQAPDGNVIASSGPMVFDSWEKGVQINLVRNENYHGSTSPDAENKGLAYVDGVQINYVTDTDAQINALMAGEAHLVMTQPQLAFEQLAQSEDFTVASTAGPVYEHWGMNVHNAHLSDPLVREALAFAMDKSEVMAGLYTPLFGDSLPAEGLGNTYWMSNQSPYQDNAGNAGYGKGDIESAQANLEKAGYTLGDDGVYVHPERGRLSLRVGTTGGNKLREIQQQLLQSKFKEAGIEITIDNVEGGAYFSERPFAPGSIECSQSGGTAGNCDIWDLAQFAWVGGPWPGGNSAVFLTGAGNNCYGYASAEFDAKSAECDSTVDDAERAACYNELWPMWSTLSLLTE
ncbi:MAG: hypothetical protein CSA55_04525 [Ilumatobacter coccineus]|uniref:Solute-binding protein family 5 domain-containing protein n=1 Tax=Ilumatobacter coccineus TaxID=467094 RepID=A0A2G6K8F4_9ACTN|nr:MAG: hypothetical protein CSA55_04525 [Ilumatobacter coccineus]